MKTLKFALAVSLCLAVQAYASPQGPKKVEGVVTDQAGAPISGAEVTVAGQAETVTRTTDAEGRFVFEAAGAAAMLTIRARGFETASRVWTAADQDAARLKITLAAERLSEHMTVFAALKSRDSEGAEAAMRTHLIRQREALRGLAANQRSRLAS